MRNYDDYKRILLLWEEGFNKSEIERQTRIPRPTIRDCIKRYGSSAQLVEYMSQNLQSVMLQILMGEVTDKHSAILRTYSYLFGLYLGDGNISKVRNVYRLRITLDARYPRIIADCSQTIRTLFPENQIGIVEHYYQEHLSCVDVSLYHKDLPRFFPQHGEGQKHLRKITLESWQQRIIEQYPLEFFRGLYHSDGSRFSNIVNGKDYPRYQFTNYSDDILNLFCETCDRLGLHWTTKARKHRAVSDIFISQRWDVEFLDREVGAKF